MTVDLVLGLEFEFLWSVFMLCIFMIHEGMICSEHLVTDRAVVGEAVGEMFGFDVIPDLGEVRLLVTAELAEVKSPLLYGKQFKVLGLCYLSST